MLKYSFKTFPIEALIKHLFQIFYIDALYHTYQYVDECKFIYLIIF